jgi:hypothetical protein
LQWSQHPINGGERTIDPFETNADDAFGNQTPLSLLCAACFGMTPRAKIGVVSFDACMQQTSEGRTSFNPSGEGRDKRLFIGHKFYELENLDDIEVNQLKATY